MTMNSRQYAAIRHRKMTRAREKAARELELAAPRIAAILGLETDAEVYGVEHSPASTHRTEAA
jgi:hypothetical protein